MSDVEPLGEVHPVVAQELERLVVGDELRDRRLAQLRREINYRLDHGLVCDIRGEIADEVAVDLQKLQREVLEVIEGAEPRSEVVEGEPAAHGGELRGELPGLVHVEDRGGLGHLEDQARGVDHHVAELLPDGARQALIAERAAREVHFQAEVSADLPLRLDQADRLPDDPEVDLLDHPGSLGSGEKRVRRQEFAVRALHPQEQLVLGDLVGSQAEDRLREEDEPLLVDRAADAIGPGRAPLGLHLGLVGGRVDAEAVAATLLGLVDRHVRLHHQALGGLGPRVRDRGHPDARGQAQAPAPEHRPVAPDRLQQLRADLARLVGVGVRQEDRELVPAQARENIGLSHLAAQEVGDAANDRVAGPVAEAVVDVFEVVEVQQENAAAALVAGGVGNPVGQLLLEPAAVEEARERIMVGEVAEAGLDPLALGDVTEAPDAPVDRPVVPALGAGVALEDAVVLEVEHVEALGVRPLVELADLADERRRVP